jgi:hypothetical protein
MNCTHRTTKVAAAFRLAATLALALILVGCTGPTAVVSPTQDLPTVRTEAASTVVAQITIDAALNPTPTTAAATPVPTEAATATTAPTATQPPAASPTPLATFTPFATQGSTGGTGGTGSSGGTGAVLPTATRRAGPDQAQFITQDPKDGAVFHAGEEFDGSWTFKNIGTSTWNTNYRIRVANNGKGTVMSKANLYKLNKEVKPGESIKVFADMVAPTSAGRYVSYWELCNDNGEIFYNYYLVVDVK